MSDPAPWSVRPPRVSLRHLLALGAGSVIASFYIGTGDITVATRMGARFGLSLWWTYFILGIAAWALIDMTVRYYLRFHRTPMSIFNMTVRYYLRFHRTPMSIFKEVHPAITGFLIITVVVCAILGSYSQWNACAMVITGFLPWLPVEASGAIAAGLALALVGFGGYARIERIFVIGIALIWRIARPDMGYFRWTFRHPRGVIVVILDGFALAVSLYVGWFDIVKRVKGLLPGK